MLWEREEAILHVQLSILVLIVEGVDNVILRSNHYPADKSYQKQHGMQILILWIAGPGQQQPKGSVRDIFLLFLAYNGCIHSAIPNSGTKIRRNCCLALIYGYFRVARTVFN